MAEHSSVGVSSPAEGSEECLTKIKIIMARPIELTPTLRGKDAERFFEMMDNVKPVSKEELERMKKNYEYFRSIATFPMPECKL